MAVYRLNDDLWFPDPHLGERSGLVAVGGDLSVKRLLLAYSNGFFPWYSFKGRPEPKWYCPLERYVIFPKEIHISHSMKQLLRQNKFQVTINQNFEGVIRGCSTVDGRNKEYGAWLGPNMIEAYTELHKLGFVSSIEVWQTQPDNEKVLVGGLYGVTLKNAFFGESMFSLVPNASKIALIFLAQFLERRGAHFIDCQFETSLFKSMGGRHIPYDEYMNMLNSRN
jgi:leucyl/phenylalanyl-tRNA--protein transferase